MSFGHKSNAPTPKERGIVLSETNFGDPLEGDFERMAGEDGSRARNRFGRETGGGFNPWQDDQERETSAQEEADEGGTGTYEHTGSSENRKRDVRPMNQGLETSVLQIRSGRTSSTIYPPTVLPLLASTTRDNYEDVLRRHLVPFSVIPHCAI